MNKLDFEIDALTGCFIVTSHVAGKRGYPRTGRDKKCTPLHREVYKFFNGSIPNKMLILHSCDNKMCINPKHLRLGLHRDNSQDAINNGKIQRGSNRPNSKLNDDKVREIRKRVKNGESQNNIRKDYGVCRKIISMVVRGKIWTHVSDL